MTPARCVFTRAAPIAAVCVMALAGCRSTTSVVCLPGGPIVSPGTVSLFVGESAQLAASWPECLGRVSGTFTFTSSAPGIATVDSRTGVVTAVGAGTAFINVTDSDAPAAIGRSAIVVAGGIVPHGLIGILQDSVPARLDSLHGTVTVYFALDAGAATVSRADVVVASTDTVVLRGPQILAGRSYTYVVPWNTDSVSQGARVFPNGAYDLSLRLLLANGTTSDGGVPPHVSVRVRNAP